MGHFNENFYILMYFYVIATHINDSPSDFHKWNGKSLCGVWLESELLIRKICKSKLQNMAF